MNERQPYDWSREGGLDRTADWLTVSRVPVWVALALLALSLALLVAALVRSSPW